MQSSRIEIGVFDHKNIVKKLDYFTSYETWSPTLAKVRNYNLNPNGGIIQTQQDVFSTNGTAVYNYCRYVIGGYWYYGYVEMVGAAGGIVTYKITCDPITTCYYAGCMDQRGMIEYSQIGNNVMPDPRRQKSNIPTILKIDGGYMFDQISNPSIIINICAMEINTIAKFSIMPANIMTYALTIDGFNEFITALATLPAYEQATYMKSIINAYYAPINFNILSTFGYDLQSVILYNPSAQSTTDNTKIIAITTGKSYKITGSSQFPIGTYFPSININGNLLQTSAARNATIKYHAGVFGDFEFTPNMFNVPINRIGVEVFWDIQNGLYKSVLMINGFDMLANADHRFVCYGKITSTIPFLTETDITNYGLERALNTQMVNTMRDISNRETKIDVTVAAVSASSQAIYNGAVGNIAGVISAGSEGFSKMYRGQQQIENTNQLSDLNISQYNQRQDHAAEYTGGAVIGGTGAGWYAFEEIYATVTYYDWLDSEFPSAYGYANLTVANYQYEPDNTERGGYIKTNAAVLKGCGYPQNIVDAAAQQLDGGVFIT